MRDIKTELLQICEAFKLGKLTGSVTLSPKVDNFILTEFTTDQGKFKHYFKIK